MRVQAFKTTRRMAWPLAALIVVLIAAGAADSALAASKNFQRSARGQQSAGKVYRWVDEKGVVHFGDQVPPEYAPIDREVLNQYGIPVATEQGILTEEEIAAERRAKAEKAALQAAARRDQVLLSTYLSVEEIEALRNRRMDLMNGQISVTSNYLQSLKERQELLQAEASKFKPYSKDPDAEPIDEKLAKELSDTVDSISLYERTLQETRKRQGLVVMAFDADITRFKQLKGL